MTKRLILAGTILIFAASGICYLFWVQEIQYSRPTPIPQDYREVPVSSVLDLQSAIRNPEKKAVFLHFFNPECPCSRFNTKHVNYLIDQYRNDVLFKVVIPFGADLTLAKDYFGANVELIEDKENGSLAETCGVYSTPQAVIIDQNQHLYYRGNYNKSRYCTQIGSNYAELALQSVIAQKPLPDFSQLATTAYGCQYFDENTLSGLSELLLN
ncbi:hypothetical protein AAG747_05880 [Rapidithrix thailandica]|uniref:DUF6436 domain-containing protein n=1 Tax=Rapidithrix thailandica TaxID=413964 RepID=A0AAW9S4S8_9BACT